MPEVVALNKEHQNQDISDAFWWGQFVENFCPESYAADPEPSKRTHEESTDKPSLTEHLTDENPVMVVGKLNLKNWPRLEKPNRQETCKAQTRVTV